jgi:RimJ/RimL family protein N-acetyltransferase
MIEAGWRLREDAWGQGYAKEAATATLDLAFGQFEADEVIALTVEKNTASWGLMLRLGMVHRPDLDFGQTHWSGEERETIVHAIDRAMWAARNG